MRASCSTWVCARVSRKRSARRRPATLPLESFAVRGALASRLQTKACPTRAAQMTKCSDSRRRMTEDERRSAVLQRRVEEGGGGAYPGLTFVVIYSHLGAAA